jgi:hypothetical protein
MDGISIAIGAFITGGIVGGWMIRKEEQRKASQRQDAEWAREDAELKEINRVRNKFGREPLGAEGWRRIREKASAEADRIAHETAVYDPARDGERWTADAPIVRDVESMIVRNQPSLPR